MLDEVDFFCVLLFKCSSGPEHKNTSRPEHLLTQQLNVALHQDSNQ